MIEEVLSQIGMTNNEIKIYLTLLKSGQLSVNVIGEKSGLHRQVCYDALERLLEKGFVSYTVQNSKKLFRALQPEKLLEFLEQKKELVKQAMPELSRLAKLPKEETIVEVMKGRNVIKAILRDVIKLLSEKRGELMGMGIDEEKFEEEDRIAIKQYINQIKKLKMKERIIARQGAKIYFEGPQTEYRLIKPEFFNPNPTFIYGNKIAHIIWGNPVTAVMIANSETYDAYRKYFEMLWKIAKPLKKAAKA
ncbi:MAG: helix-turn-helix domain-containing protein [Nanoarchaeota archaeon]